MKTILPLIVIFFLAAGCGTAPPQNSDDGNGKPTTASLISDNNFRFHAQSATPLNGRVIQLTSEYEVIVTKDTVTSFLPYFGRAFTAPMDPSQGGIKFTAVKFSNKLRQRRNGGWELTIKPTDATDIQTLNFSVTQSGYATLQVTSTNKQPISFYGIIEPNTLKNNR